MNKGKLGFYKSKLRSGMCAYCKQFDEKEEPLITSIENDIIAKLSELQPLFFERWRCHVASKAEYTRPGFQAAASPMYWDAFLAFIAKEGRDHVALARRLANEFVAKFKEKLMPVVIGIAWHLKLWRNQQEQFELQLNQLEPFTLGCAADYAVPWELNIRILTPMCTAVF